jgi:hypothetical protein
MRCREASENQAVSGLRVVGVACGSRVAVQGLRSSGCGLRSAVAVGCVFAAFRSALQLTDKRLETIHAMSMSRRLHALLARHLNLGILTRPVAARHIENPGRTPLFN